MREEWLHHLECSVHVALTREGAFARCLMEYTPGVDVDAALEAFLEAPPDQPEVLRAGELDWEYLAARVVDELRPREHYALLKAGRPRFTPRHAVPATAVDASEARHFQLRHWDYVGVSDTGTATDMLELHSTADIVRGDTDLRAAARWLRVRIK